jgi:hypothetical protein
MTSADAPRSTTGASGIACDDVMPIRPRPMANTDAVSSFMALPFLSNVPRRGGFKLQSRQHQGSPVAPPVMVMPVMVAPAPVTTAPAPMAAVPTPVPVMAPMHLFGLELLNLLRRRHRGMGIRVRHRTSTAPGKRLWREWRGLGAGGERGTSRESEGKPEKMSTFHGPLLAFPTIDRDQA